VRGHRDNRDPALLEKSRGPSIFSCVEGDRLQATALLAHGST
jgi:hypothetical protein